MHRQIRILQCFGGGLTSGGIETLFVTFQELMPKDIHFDYLTVRAGDEFYGRRIREMGSRHYACGVTRNIGSWKRLYKRIGYTYKLFRREKYDVIHISDSPVSGLLIGLLAKLCNNGLVILHSHTDLTSQTASYSYKMSKWIKKLMPGITHHYMACSRQAAISAFPPQYVDKVYVLKNGVDTNALKFNLEKREKIRKKLKLGNSFVVGNVARLSFQKNQKFIIDLMPRLKKMIPTAKLLLVGCGSDEQMLKDLTDSLHLQDDVLFYGETSDIVGVLSAMDVFAFPSVFEGFGMSALEAQVSGLHVIANDALPQELDVNGIVHWNSLDDKEGWLNELKRVYDNGGRADITSAIVEKGYDIHTSANELAEYYRKLTNTCE